MKFPQTEEVGEVGATGNKSGGSGTVQAPSVGGGLDWGEVYKKQQFSTRFACILGGGFLYN